MTEAPDFSWAGDPLNEQPLLCGGSNLRSVRTEFYFGLRLRETKLLVESCATNSWRESLNITIRPDCALHIVLDPSLSLSA